MLIQLLEMFLQLEENDCVKEMPGQAEKVPQRQDSVSSRRNGAVSQVPTGNMRVDSTKRMAGRAPSAAHMTINKQDSCISNISQASSGSGGLRSHCVLRKWSLSVVKLLT